jgi:hypothetical protein
MSPRRGRGRLPAGRVAGIGSRSWSRWRPAARMRPATGPLLDDQRALDHHCREAGGDRREQHGGHRNGHPDQRAASHADDDAERGDDRRERARPGPDRPAHLAVPGAMRRPRRGSRLLAGRKLGRDRDIGGDGVQVRVRAGGERLCHPLVEFVFGQAILHERGLEHLDRPFPVGARSPHAAFASWPDHHRRLPHERGVSESLAWMGFARSRVRRQRELDGGDRFRAVLLR